jgi:DNA-binding FadR family transcriptional regulator
MEIQGLLEVKHGVGVRVVNKPQAPVGATLARELPDLTERLRQFAEVRLLVEPAIARAAAERAGPAERAALRSAHERLGTTLEEAVPADLEFHRLLAEVAGNRVLSLMLSSIAGLEAEVARLRDELGRLRKTMMKQLTETGSIVAAAQRLDEILIDILLGQVRVVVNDVFKRDDPELRRLVEFESLVIRTRILAQRQLQHSTVVVMGCYMHAKQRM